MKYKVGQRFICISSGRSGQAGFRNDRTMSDKETGIITKVDYNTNRFECLMDSDGAYITRLDDHGDKIKIIKDINPVYEIY